MALFRLNLLGNIGTLITVVARDAEEDSEDSEEHQRDVDQSTNADEDSNASSVEERKVIATKHRSGPEVSHDPREAPPVAIQGTLEETLKAQTLRNERLVQLRSTKKLGIWS